MQTILILGAGRSASVLIKYMLEHSISEDWKILVADLSKRTAFQKIDGHERGTPIRLDIENQEKRKELIKSSDFVISLLPARLHHIVAMDCLVLHKHLITPSYVSDELKELGKAVENSGLMFLGEMGLDPGLDHMSAMKILHEIEEKGGELLSFKSYTGGLIAPESDDNPWHYKFTWNPRNVVLAGQGTAQYLLNGQIKFIPYNRVFSETETISVPEMGEYEVYANRDSLKYREIYDLEHIPTFIRGTIRCLGFTDAWNALVKLGLTDDSFPIENSDQLTYKELVQAYLSGTNSETNVEDLKAELAYFIGVKANGEIIKKLEWLGLFSDQKITLHKASPAQILQQLLEQKWSLKQEDNDMIIMQHEFIYKVKNEIFKWTSSLVDIGKNEIETSMSKLVGLPMGIFVRHFLKNNPDIKGVVIPTDERVYKPVLKEMEELGIVFKEEIVLIEE